MLPYFNFPVNFPVPAPVEFTIANVPNIPFYSQFQDIKALEWRKLSCGIASLAMIIEFYSPGSVTPQKLLTEGINSGAYIRNAGWSHQGLANLASRYGLFGKTYDLSKLDSQTAFNQFKNILKDGPVIASVHYKFDPKSTIPHLVVINGIDGGTIYYNDPAGHTAGEKISIADFLLGWKKRFITVRTADFIFGQV